MSERSKKHLNSEIIGKEGSDFTKTLKKFIELSNKTYQEAEAICELTEIENNNGLSLTISKNLATTAFNIFRARLALGFGMPDNWKYISDMEVKEAKRTEELTRAENELYSSRSVYIDINDTVASEALPLVKFSQQLVKQSQELLKLSERLDISDSITKQEVFDMSYDVATSLIVFSQKLVENKK